MNWVKDRYIEGTFGKFEFRNRLALFDLDDTLICVKSNNDFSVDENDWKFFSSNVKNTLNKLYNDGYCLIIITNQLGISKGKTDISLWMKKVDNVCKDINLPIKLYSSIEKDRYRKPFPSFYDIICKNVTVNSAFFAGDACGRKTDHSQDDYKFALNCKLEYMLPEELFDGKKKIDRPPIKYKVYLNKDDDKRNRLLYENQYINVFKKKDMIIMFGQQGSGKSYMANILKYQGYVVISNDILGTKAKCLKTCKQELIKGSNVIIDNTNGKKENRKEYIDLAKEYGYSVKCFVMECNKDLAIHNTLYRMYRNEDAKKIPDVAVNTYLKHREDVTKDEGFDEVVKMNFTPPDNDAYYYYFE